LKILQKAEVSELTSGRVPQELLLLQLYVAALINDEKKTQREVADVAGITEVTIRNRYKELLDRLDLEDKMKIKENEKKKKKE
jgi:transcription initiation factor TFIIB